MPIDITFSIEPAEGVIYPYRVRFTGLESEVEALVASAREAGMLNAERNSASVAVSAHELPGGRVCTVVEVASVDTYAALLHAMEAEGSIAFAKEAAVLVEEARALTVRPKQMA